MACKTCGGYVWFADSWREQDDDGSEWIIEKWRCGSCRRQWCVKVDPLAYEPEFEESENQS